MIIINLKQVNHVLSCGEALYIGRFLAQCTL